VLLFGITHKRQPERDAEVRSVRIICTDPSGQLLGNAVGYKKCEYFEVNFSYPKTALKWRLIVLSS
jgi:hypothetical protein